MTKIQTQAGADLHFYVVGHLTACQPDREVQQRVLRTVDELIVTIEQQARTGAEKEKA